MVLTNSDIHYEIFELTESICSEQNLVFGSCEPSMVKFRVSNIVTSLKNQWLTVSETLEGGADEPFLFGRYKVFADELTSDRKYRDITAYDALHDALEEDLTSWYNNLLPNNDSELTQKQFRDSLFEFLGIEQEDIVLPNDDMIIQRTIQPEQIFGYDVLTALCEINGCFGHIGRNGRFQYIFLKEMVDGLYPSDTLYPMENLFPTDPVNVEQIKRSHYISATYEDFVTEKITKLQIRQEEDDIGCIYGTGDNCYIVQDNFLVYGKSTEELQIIAQNIYSVISNVTYRPAHVEAKGNPCLEVGDGIRLATTHEIVRTYILQRTLKGIQALRDVYDAEGEQYQSEKVNSVHESIVQLKGKTNKLSRTIEETRMEIADIEKGLRSEIVQTAADISLSVKENYTSKTELSTAKTEAINTAASDATAKANAAESNAKSDTDEKLKSYSTTKEMQSAIELASDNITLSVSNTYETKIDSTSKYNGLSGKITINADSITTEVRRAQAQEAELASAISVNADNILLKVSKGDVSSQISQESDKITIKSNRFSLESTNCTIKEDGTISAKNVDLKGKITADSGEIGGFTIGDSAIYADSSVLGGRGGIYLGTEGISVGNSFVVDREGNITLGLDTDIEVGGVLKFNNAAWNGIKYGGYTIFTINSYSHAMQVAQDIIIGSGKNLELSSGNIIMSGSTSYIRGSTSTNYKIKFETSRTTIIDSYSVLGKSGGYVGFFGSDGATKKSISTITSTSSATASTNASKINEIINALKAYNLIG